MKFKDSPTVFETSIPDLHLLRRGKVRDVYEIDDDSLLFIATDRISAFDCILPTPIPLKGRVLTSISLFWFDLLKPVIENHLLTSDLDSMPKSVRERPEVFQGRTMLVKRARVFPIECVVRGYLAGSGWKDYLRTGEVCGHILPEGLHESSRLKEPIFTPATKAETGHDQNISFDKMSEIVGVDAASKLRDVALELYGRASDFALSRGIIIADTKFEMGIDDDEKIILVDEVLTPDSSRFWPADSYEEGDSQASFDKQYVRDYLETLDWDKTPPAPALPETVARATTERYLEAFRRLTGTELQSTG